MARLRLVGLAGALVVAALAAGAVVGGGSNVVLSEFRVLSSGVAFGFVALIAVVVVVVGSRGAQTLDSTYW